jgi:molybdopterin-containing oxidoreductase family membrane subunit
MNKIILLTGSMVGFAYSMEFFIAWYSGSMYEKFAFINRAFGQYAWAYWIMVSCNVLTPQIFWFKWARTNILVMFIASLLVNVGMWFERFVIVITSLANDFMPSAWGYYKPTWVDICMLIGSFGLFMTLFLLFIRYLPVIAIAEVKAVMPQAKAHPHHPATAEHGDYHGEAEASEAYRSGYGRGAAGERRGHA